MKEHNLIKVGLITLLIIGVMLFSGCTGDESGSKLSSASPSTVVESYYKELMGWSSNYKKMYNLISDNAKSGDYDIWEDTHVIIKNGYLREGASFTFMRVENETIKDDMATVTVKYKITVQGFPVTKTKTVELVRERGSWKLAKSYGLEI